MPVSLAALVAGVLLLGGAPGVSAREGTIGVDPFDTTRAAAEPFKEFSVAAHAPTTLWSNWTEPATRIRAIPQWTVLRVVRAQKGTRLYVWDQDVDDYGWVAARDVGPHTSSLPDPNQPPPTGVKVIYKGAAKVTMYTCVELGGCGRTATGIRPKPGIVAVDPKLIPLGSKVWIEGFGTFVAADTGGAVKGAHVDVFSTNHQEAVRWGMKNRPIIAYKAD
jgi:3D (Asp-Asp-Asp) domain-containing protein